MTRIMQPKNSKTINLFNDRTRDSGSVFNTKVHIDTKSGVIVGHLTEEFKWNMSAQWKPLFQGSEKFSFVQSGFKLQGEQFFNQGIFTRKYYKGEAYLELPLKFRVTDFEGTGIVMTSSKALADSMLPRVSSLNAKKTIGPISDTPLVNDIAQVGSNLAQIAGTVASGAFQPFLSVINAVGETGKTNSDYEGMLDNLETEKTGSTLAVSVKIGNIFEDSSMVVVSGNVSYSKAQVKNNLGAIVGPLYADFDVKLSSRSVKPKGSSGVLGQVSITNSNVNINA